MCECLFSAIQRWVLARVLCDLHGVRAFCMHLLETEYQRVVVNNCACCFQFVHFHLIFPWNVISVTMSESLTEVFGSCSEDGSDFWRVHNHSWQKNCRWYQFLMLQLEALITEVILMSESNSNLCFSLLSLNSVYPSVCMLLKFACVLQ